MVSSVLCFKVMARSLVSVCFLSFFTFAGLAHAEQPLTQKVITNWLNSLDALEAWSKKNEEAFNRLETNDQDNGLSPEVMISELKATGLYSDAAALMRKQGFNSPEEWADVQVRIMKATMSLQMEVEAQNTDIQAEIDKIRSNPDIPQEYKDQMIAMMESSKQTLEALSNASPADKAAVKPFLGQIMTRLEQMDVDEGEPAFDGEGIPRE